MYLINERLATHGIPQGNLYMSYNECEIGHHNGFRIVDVRPMMDDGTVKDKEYNLNISRVISYLQCDEKVVVCCSAGISRSNAIALGTLVKYFKMDFYDAWELIRKKVPIVDIDPSHIAALKRIFHVTIP